MKQKGLSAFILWALLFSALTVHAQKNCSAVLVHHSEEQLRFYGAQVLSAHDSAYTLSLRRLHIYGADEPAVQQLTDGEFVALMKYLGSEANDINRALWHGESNPYTPLIALIENGLQKLPIFKGLVRRRMMLQPEQIARYQVGGLVNEKGFISTSKGMGNVSALNSNNITFIITSESGRSIDLMNQVSNEREVLFPRGTRFLVTSKKRYTGRYSGERWVVRMKEVN